MGTQYPYDNYPQNSGLPNNEGQNPPYPPGYAQPYPPTQYAQPYPPTQYEQPGSSYPPPPQYQQPDAYPPLPQYQQADMYPPPAGYSAYGAPVTTQDKSMGFAIAGLVLGIIAIISSWYPICGLPIPIVGIVMSALGRRSVSHRTMATVGLVLSIIAIAIGILITAIVIIAAIANSTHS